MLLDTIQHAYDIMRECDWLHYHWKLLPPGYQNISMQGAMMDKELMDSEDEEGRCS
jgi:hypothetical protein